MTYGRFIVVVALLLSGCAHAPLSEHIAFGEDKRFQNKIQGWQVLDYENFRDGGFSHYYVPPGAGSLKSWSQLITMAVIVGANIPLQQYVDASTNAYNAKCPGTIHHVIEADEYNVYYTNTYPACGKNAPQSEITRMARGNEGLYRLSYTVKGRELSQSEKDEWLSIFHSGYIAKGDKHERVR